MNADDQLTPKSPAAARRRSRSIARTALSLVLKPYLRRRAQTVATLARLEADLEHVRERHTEQIERLEDLVSELVLSVEALRRDVVWRGDGGEQ